MAGDVLGLESRRRLYHHVVRHPGKYLRELQRDVGMPMGALEYHLGELARAGLVTVLQEGHKRFFPRPMASEDRRILVFLRQDLPRRILLAVLERGGEGCPRSHLLARLEVAPSTLAYHLGHLVAVGLLVDRGTGADARFAVLDAAGVQRLLTVYRSSLVDRMVDGYLAGLDAMR